MNKHITQSDLDVEFQVMAAEMLHLIRSEKYIGTIAYRPVLRENGKFKKDYYGDFVATREAVYDFVDTFASRHGKIELGEKLEELFPKSVFKEGYPFFQTYVLLFMEHFDCFDEQARFNSSQ